MALNKLSFPTDVKRDDSERDNVELPINGETYYAYRPTQNSIALFFASQGSKNVAERVAGALSFLEQNVEPAAYRLMIRAVESDVLPFETLVEMVFEIIEEFAENPTGSSTGSTSSQAASGRASTESSRRPASTRRPSTRRVSAD